MDEQIREMDKIQDDLHLHLGLVQKKLIRMASKPHRTDNKPHRTVVQFRKLPDSFSGKKNEWSEFLRGKEKNLPESLGRRGKNLPNKDDMFILELGYRDPYTDVVARVADKLHVDHTRIRIARHICYSNKPNPISHKFTGCLLHLLESSTRMCNVLYYKVLPEDHLKTNEVAYDHPHANQVLGKLKAFHRVYHVTKTDGGEESMKPFTCIAFCDDETVGEVKVRLLSKLTIHKDEFSKWRFSLLQRGGQPVYLEDNDILHSRLEGKGDQFLILEGPVVTLDDILTRAFKKPFERLNVMHIEK